jgi:hypothetical protein
MNGRTPVTVFKAGLSKPQQQKREKSPQKKLKHRSQPKPSTGGKCQVIMVFVHTVTGNDNLSTDSFTNLFFTKFNEIT